MSQYKVELTIRGRVKLVVDAASQEDALDVADDWLLNAQLTNDENGAASVLYEAVEPSDYLDASPVVE